MLVSTRSGSELTLTSTDTDTSYGLSSATDGDGDIVMRLTNQVVQLMMLK